MILIDRYLLVRAGAVYIVAVLTLAAWVWRRPRGRVIGAAALAGFWNLPVVLALNLVADIWPWWRFDATGGLFMGVPVDLYLVWVWMWGVLPVLAFPSLSPMLVALVVLGADLVLMPAAAPVIRLGPFWLVGEILGLAVGVLPGLLLARWTMRDEQLRRRVTLQVLAFSGLLLFLLPAIAIDGSGAARAWSGLFTLSAWQLSLAAQVLAVPAVFGISAVQEFATRGGGTPVPFDAPRRLVTSGPYAYARNPMQLAAVVTLLLLAVLLRNVWLGAAALMAHAYAQGLAGWDEDEDLRRRFGEEWSSYRRQVRAWLPRFRPWYAADRIEGRLFVAARCGMCSEVGRWLAARNPRGLAITAAEAHPSDALMRMRYEPADGSPPADGVIALARALEHVHLGWAFVGFALRLPIVAAIAQLFADASGAGPRDVKGRR